VRHYLLGHALGDLLVYWKVCLYRKRSLSDVSDRKTLQPSYIPRRTSASLGASLSHPDLATSSSCCSAPAANLSTLVCRAAILL